MNCGPVSKKLHRSQADSNEQSSATGRVHIPLPSIRRWSAASFRQLRRGVRAAGQPARACRSEGYGGRRRGTAIPPHSSRRFPVHDENRVNDRRNAGWTSLRDKYLGGTKLAAVNVTTNGFAVAATA